MEVLEGDIMEDMDDEDEFEDMEVELDWSESHADSLTPSQHSQPGRNLEEVRLSLLQEKLLKYLILFTEFCFVFYHHHEYLTTYQVFEFHCHHISVL